MQSACGMALHLEISLAYFYVVHNNIVTQNRWLNFLSHRYETMWPVSAVTETVVSTAIDIASTLSLRKKRHPFYICDNLVRCHPIFDRNVPQRI